MTENPTSKTLSAYLDGELGADDVAAVEKVLRQSPAAQEELEQLRMLNGLLSDAGRDLMKEPLSIDLVSSVHQRVFREASDKAGQSASGFAQRDRFPPFIAAAAAALIAMILAFPAGYFVSSSQHDLRLAELRIQLEADRMAFAQFVAQALERRLSGETVAWQNARSGSSGSVTPVRTFRNADGEWCREYREEVNLAEEYRARRAIACRSPEGEWRTRLIAAEES